MAIRDIRLFGDPVLNTAAAEVAVFDAALERLVADMLETMDHAGGVGLAANQIGLARRIFVFDCQGMRGHIINPVWEPLGEEMQTGVEGCLSVPDVRGEVTRHKTVVARGQDCFGRPLTLRGTGLLARCIQHEADHLDGVMFMRRMAPEQRKEAMAAIRAADWS
ncbi:peptide deformylase [Corynebacterium sp. HMSC05H05]|uniref:peptide deformylase n=1 Tax=unclassified Corynebacterium TaxID=2624378 RepID=UPI0008A28961|nr:MULTISPECIES: peptide deformylase [unclassified Corynebacterium]OFT58511.1 peptide deformylase [Corynebacterium sp. HMSC05H05]OHR22329.1 peptide deformylase [Corynebacterium sp. HMSC034A01]